MGVFGWRLCSAHGVYARSLTKGLGTVNLYGFSRGMAYVIEGGGQGGNQGEVVRKRRRARVRASATREAFLPTCLGSAWRCYWQEDLRIRPRAEF